jgi:hypothetical protein
MSDFSDPAIIEAYEIARTVEILLESKRHFRLEVVRTRKGANVEPYHVTAYERMNLYRAPDGSVSSKCMEKAVEFHVWIQDLHLPSYTYHREKAEEALSVALALLVERRNNENTPW